MQRERHDRETVIRAIRQAQGLIAPAAQALGYDRRSLYSYIKRHQLEPVIADARESALDFAESYLWRQITEGNITAIIFFLKTIGKSRGYVERAEVTGRDGGAIEVTDPFTTVLVGLWEEHAEHRNGSTHAS